jgi:hypothetical protein
MTTGYSENYVDFIAIDDIWTEWWFDGWMRNLYTHCGTLDTIYIQTI